MEPIVYGLEQEYAGRLAFARVDAASDQGRDLMESYTLRGHPAFAIVDPSGKPLWTRVGPLEAQQLREVIAQAFADAE